MTRPLTTDEAHKLAARQISEKQLQQWVYDLARTLGWRCIHHWDSRHSTAGWPDLFCVKAGNGGKGRAVGIELKRESGRLTDGQKSWMIDLMAAGIECRVFRPHDWLDGTVERFLRDGESLD